MRRTGLHLLLLGLLAGCGQSSAAPSFDQVGNTPQEHGERLAHVLGCTGCHGQDLTGKDWSSADFVRMSTANLTVAAADYTPAQFDTTIRTGRRPDGRELWDMPSHLFTNLRDRDMSALIAYLRAQPRCGEAHPVPIFYALARKEMAAGTYKSSATEAKEVGSRLAPDAGPGHDQARHIVRATCAECHGVELRGGVPFPGAPFRPDLRMVAAYSKGDFMTLMTTGKAAGNRELPMMSGVSRGRFAKLTASEREGIYAYLVALAKKEP